jgi:hypothetical protein
LFTLKRSFEVTRQIRRPSVQSDGADCIPIQKKKIGNTVIEIRPIQCPENISESISRKISQLIRLMNPPLPRPLPFFIFFFQRALSLSCFPSFRFELLQIEITESLVFYSSFGCGDFGVL